MITFKPEDTSGIEAYGIDQHGTMQGASAMSRLRERERDETNERLVREIMKRMRDMHKRGVPHLRQESAEDSAEDTVKRIMKEWKKNFHRRSVPHLEEQAARTHKRRRDG